MYRFQHTPYLYTLALLPLLAIVFALLLAWRSSKLSKIGERGLIRSQLTGFIPGRTTFKFLLASLALALTIIGWANFQKGIKPESRTAKGIDVMIALDVSKSMLAQDIAPDRLTRARLLIERMMDKMHEDRVGLVIFAGRAYPQVPITADYSAVLLSMQSIRPESVPEQGTVLADAIKLAAKSFSQKERKFKSLIIISDGEDHDDGAIAAARKAAEEGVVIHTIGVGSPQGAPLLDPGNKLPRYDDDGQPIITRLNEKELTEIAQAGKGTYQLLGNEEAAATAIATQLDGMEQKAYGTVAFTEWRSYFYYFLGGAFLLLVLENLLTGARNYKKRIA